MAVNYTKLPVQFGALLRVSRALQADWEFAKQASDASHYRRVLSVANGFGQSDSEEATAYGFMCSYYDSLAEKAGAEWVAHRGKIEDSSKGLWALLKRDLPASDERDAGGSIAYDYEDILGAITISARRGILGALRKDMLTQTQYVTANGITFGGGALTADNGNRGALPTVTVMTGLSHTLTGTLVLTVNSESVTKPTLDVSVELPYPLPDETEIVWGDRVLTLEKSWQDGPTGLTITLTRPGLAAPVEAGDDGNMFSVYSFATPAEGDMNGGVLYVRVIRQATAGSEWLIEYYNSSALTTKVGSDVTGTLVGNFTTTKPLKNGTAFTYTFDRVAANVKLPVATNEDTVSFDIQTPREGDRWTRAITNDEAGVLSTKIAKLWRASLPVAGAVLWAEANGASITKT